MLYRTSVSRLNWLRQVSVTLFSDFGVQYLAQGTLPHADQGTQTSNLPITRHWLSLSCYYAHCCGTFVRGKHSRDGPRRFHEKSFGSADFWVEMGENLISLISQHPILYDKHHNNYLDNQVEDNMWAEIQEAGIETGITGLIRVTFYLQRT